MVDFYQHLHGDERDTSPVSVKLRSCLMKDETYNRDTCSIVLFFGRYFYKDINYNMRLDQLMLVFFLGESYTVWL